MDKGTFYHDEESGTFQPYAGSDVKPQPNIKNEGAVTATAKFMEGFAIVVLILYVLGCIASMGPVEYDPSTGTIEQYETEEVIVYPDPY